MFLKKYGITRKHNSTIRQKNSQNYVTDQITCAFEFISISFDRIFIYLIDLCLNLYLVQILPRAFQEQD